MKLTKSLSITTTAFTLFFGIAALPDTALATEALPMDAQCEVALSNGEKMEFTLYSDFNTCSSDGKAELVYRTSESSAEQRLKGEVMVDGCSQGSYLLYLFEGQNDQEVSITADGPDGVYVSLSKPGQDEIYGEARCRPADTQVTDCEERVSR